MIRVHCCIANQMNYDDEVDIVAVDAAEEIHHMVEVVHVNNVNILEKCYDDDGDISLKGFDDALLVLHSLSETWKS